MAAGRSGKAQRPNSRVAQAAFSASFHLWCNASIGSHSSACSSIMSDASCCAAPDGFVIGCGCCDSISSQIAAESCRHSPFPSRTVGMMSLPTLGLMRVSSCSADGVASVNGMPLCASNARTLAVYGDASQPKRVQPAKRSSGVCNPPRRWVAARLTRGTDMAGAASWTVVASAYEERGRERAGSK